MAESAAASAGFATTKGSAFLALVVETFVLQAVVVEAFAVEVRLEVQSSVKLEEELLSSSCIRGSTDTEQAEQE